MRRELAVPTSGSCRKDRTDVPEPSVGNETAEVCAAGVQQLKIILKQQVKQKRTDETKDQQFWGRNASIGGRKCKAAIRHLGAGTTAKHQARQIGFVTEYRYGFTSSDHAVVVTSTVLQTRSVISVCATSR